MIFDSFIRQKPTRQNGIGQKKKSNINSTNECDEVSRFNECTRSTEAIIIIIFLVFDICCGFALVICSDEDILDRKCTHLLST